MAPVLNQDTKGSDLVAHYAPQIAGKIILVTGGSPGGLGEKFSQLVAAAGPAFIILTGRNVSKVQPVADAITAEHPNVKTRVLELDLTSLASVRKAAETVNGWEDVPRIDVLVNNAGIMAVPFSMTQDGFESQFQTNHLSHFLFTNLIMDKILKSESPRIVNVSSSGHRFSQIRWTDYNFNEGKHYDKWVAYGQSKTANILTASSLAEKLGASRGLVAVSLHPGVIMTNLGRDLSSDMAELFEDLRQADAHAGSKYMWGGGTTFKPKDADEGVANHVYTAFDPDLAKVNGSYFHDCHVADPYEEEIWPWAESKTSADMLWKLSEKLVGQEFKY